MAEGIDRLKRVLSTVERCPHCGGQHKLLGYTREDYDPADYTWWSVCPETQQPLTLTLHLDAMPIKATEVER